MTVEEHNELAKAQALAKARERARAFRELFTTPRGPQVLDALYDRFWPDRTFPPNCVDDTGRTDLYQTARKLGACDILSYITLQLDWKESEHVHTSNGGA